MIIGNFKINFKNFYSSSKKSNNILLDGDYPSYTPKICDFGKIDFYFYLFSNKFISNINFKLI